MPDMKITSLEEATRLAKAMASDIAIYNVDKIKRGLENDRLFEELAEDLKEADRTWRLRVDDSIREKHNLFQRAFVDVVFGSHSAGDYPIF